MNNKVLKNMIYNFTGNMVTKVISFLVVAVTARVFGSAIFGEYNIALTEYSYFLMISVFGTSGYGLYLLAKENDHQEQQRIISEISTVKMIMGVIASIAVFIYVLLPSTHNCVWPYFLLLLFQSCEISWIFQALQDMRITAFASMIITPVNAILLILFFLLGVRNVYTLIFPNIISTLSLYLVYVVYLRKKYGLSISVKKVNIIKFLKNSFPYMASGIFAGINTNIDILIMGYVQDNSMVGYYSADYKIVNEFISICSIIFTPLFPMFVEKIANGDIKNLNSIIGKLRTVLMSFIIPCAIIGVIFGRNLLSLLYGREYENGYVAFAILLIYVVLLYYREIYGYALSAAGKQSLYLRIVSLSGMCNVILNLIFIPYYGIVAAAATTLLSELINLFGMKYYTEKNINLQIENYNLNKLIFLCVFTFGIAVLLKFSGIYYIFSIVIIGIGYIFLYCLAGVIDPDLINRLLKNN